MDTNKIIKGDCIEELKKLPDNSVDAVITDPPYGLGFMNKEWDNPKKHRELIEREKKRSEQRAKEGKSPTKACFSTCVQPGLAIKGAKEGKWYQEWCELWAIECLRILKPGGYMLVCSAPRMYHRMATGVEDAGFEIRDCIQWLYGSGFPKSYNIGKGIQKLKTQGNASWNGTADPKNKPLGYSKLQHKQCYRPNDYSGNNKDNVSTELTEEEAKQWEGWGTALKPAVEPIVVARKPLSEKNVALNVLKWGTGGINIDACRIGNEAIKNGREGRKTEGHYSGGWKDCPEKINQGRFPANIILDEEAGKMLDEQSGKTGAISPVKSGQKGFGGVIYNKYKTGGDDGKSFYDEGRLAGASRFFYVAKASKSERNFGCEDMEIPEYRWNNAGEFKQLSGQKGNKHPTVKPIKLMEYLIKLVSKEGAVILDPFLGSGTTAIACINLNRQFIGIEKEEEYIKIAQARIKPFLEQRKL